METYITIKFICEAEMESVNMNRHYFTHISTTCTNYSTKEIVFKEVIEIISNCNSNERFYEFSSIEERKSLSLTFFSKYYTGHCS